MITFLEVLLLSHIVSRLSQLDIGYQQIATSIILGVLGLAVATWVFIRQYELSLAQIKISKEQLFLTELLYMIQMSFDNIDDINRKLEKKQTKRQIILLEETRSMFYRSISILFKSRYNGVKKNDMKDMLKTYDKWKKNNGYENDRILR